MQAKKTYALIILDGWGCEAASPYNAITQANTPTWDQLWQHYPHVLLAASNEEVGLPHGQMGNSEVGHMTIGAGRIIYQDLVRINQAILDQSFFHNPILCQIMQQTHSHALHLIGLLSDGGVHSHIDHLIALLKLAKQQKVAKVYIHAILDGRDTSPQSANKYLLSLAQAIQEIGVGQIVSICGRFYAMDRDQRFERTEVAYNLIVAGMAEYHFDDPITALAAAYARGENDEFVKPTIINPAIKMHNNDSVICFNFRSDRMRQIVRALALDNFDGFNRNYRPQLSTMATFTEYERHLSCQVIFAPQTLHNTLGQYLSDLNKTQLRIAETEKYAHVTFFFNGGIETPYNNETRVLVPSPKVQTYDLKPEMSAYEVTDKLVAAINSQKFDIIICNFANPDMVGHTGNLPAAITAIEVVDDCLNKIITALQASGGEALITADHGNIECMFDQSQKQPHTAHTTNLVPLLYVGRTARAKLADYGKLSDVAPTLLSLMGIAIPQEMTGRVLFTVD